MRQYDFANVTLHREDDGTTTVHGLTNPCYVLFDDVHAVLLEVSQDMQAIFSGWNWYRVDKDEHGRVVYWFCRW